MQAVCTCFLHEIPLAPNSVYVNRIGSNFVTALNVRSALYKPVVQKNPPLDLSREKTMIFIRSRRV